MIQQKKEQKCVLEAKEDFKTAGKLEPKKPLITNDHLADGSITKGDWPEF